MEEPGIKTGKTTITFTAQATDPSTKATLTPNSGDSAFEAAWEQNDELRLIVSNGSTSEETIAAWNATDNVFSATYQTLSGTNNWTYKAIWPVPGKSGIEFGSNRTQNGNSYNSSFDVMYGSKSVSAPIGKESDGNTPLFIPMDRLTGIAYFHITGGPAGEKVVSAKLEAANIAAETVSVVDGALSVPETKLNEINLTINGDLSAEDFALWFNVLPGSYPTLKLTITTNSGKTASINASNLTYAAGKLNKAVLNNLVWGKDSEYSNYSILFIDKNVSSAQEISTSTQASTFIEEESLSFVTTKPVSAVTKSYYGQATGNPQPLRVGTSSAAGSITLSLSSSGSVSATSIIVKAKQYSSGKTKTIGVNGSEKQKPGDSYTDLTFNLGGSPISSITLDTDGYIYIKSLTINYIVKESVTLSFGETTEFEITQGDEFTPPTLSTSPSGLTVSYTSSNTDVATVNESTGAVSIVGIGSTTITAIFAGNNTYNAASASYTLKVNRALSTSIAEIKEDLANGSDSFSANLTNAIVTRKFSDYIAYIQDETAGIYVTDAAELTEGDSFSGTIFGEMTTANNQPKITSIDVSGASKTSGSTIPDPVVVTIAELNTNMSNYDGMLCKVVKAKAEDNLASGTNKSITILQGDNNMTLFTRPSFDAGSIVADNYYDIVGIPCLYNTTKEFVVLSTNDVVASNINWQLSSISIATAPTKVAYNVGDYFIPAGLVISTMWQDATDNSLTKTETVEYNDDTKDSFSFSPSLDTQLTTSNTSVVITYSGKTAEQTISVVEAGQETVVYTLTPTSGANNVYASSCDILISGITWNLTGNSQTIPWRIGGKSLASIDRTLYSKTALNYNISKIEITHGAASGITVNSMTVIVASDSGFSNIVSTLTPSFAANNTITIERPAGASWSNCYYKIVYNVTVTGASNKFIEFTEAKFTGK